MANDEPANYVREKMWVTRRAGTRLSRSQKAPGQLSPLTRDDSNELGQVTLSPVDVDEPTLWDDTEQTRSPESPAFAEAVADAAVVMIGRVLDGLIEEAKPHVKRWWTEQALPAIRSAARSTRRPTTGARVTAPVLEEPTSLIWI